MHPLLEMLTGGDRRSVGRVDEVMEVVHEQPDLMAVLIQGMREDDPLVRMRAADAVEKITVESPVWLQPFKRILLEDIALSEQQEVRWHIAQILPRLELDKDERVQAVQSLTNYLQDRSAIVRTFSLQALAELAVGDKELEMAVNQLLQARLASGSKAEQSRARKLLGL